MSEGPATYGGAFSVFRTVGTLSDDSGEQIRLDTNNRFGGNGVTGRGGWAVNTAHSVRVPNLHYVLR
jgi:hypothetical protein